MSKRWFFLGDHERLHDSKIGIPIKHLGEREANDLFPDDISKEWGEDIETDEGQGDD